MNAKMRVVIHLVSISTFITHVISYVIKTIPEDQEYAENLLLDPNQKSTDPKTCLRKDLRHKTKVCDISPDEFFEICKEAVDCENIRSLYTSFILDFDQIPEPCQNYTVRVFRSKTSEEFTSRVQARQCPTIIGGHPLWISQGNEQGGIFVFSPNPVGDQQLRVEDYIMFIDTVDSPER